MGRTDYIVTAGVGFDLDRSSAKNTIGGFEAVASTLNAVSTKKAAEGFAKNEAVYQKSLNKISKANKKADEDLVKGVAQSAKSAQASIQKSMPKPLSPAKAAKMSTKELKAYNTAFKASMKGMSKSYGKFAKEAEKLGIKVTKAGGFGKGKSVSDFSKKDVETRKRLINLTERMAKSEKEKLDGIKKGTKAYLKQKAEVEALERQHKDMKNLNEDIMQQERKTGKIKSKNAKKERQAEKKKGAADKAVIQRQKVIAQGLQRIGKVASMSAGKISSGLKNAFVIGTAAAAAFFYKMQPLAETVQEFEKTIINANSVFNETREVLHSVSDEMVRFTLKYGVSAQDMATGLYQLASAGLTAAESQEVLQHTMKLAMATQGDHNALAKLTVQTIMGFGMEMTDSAELVDKFAHSIQKSLIEWEDLASSVKFAMPFFVATGQSVDELLGGLEVLTNRALEAGIAGRGLRQALAQFAKHADDNSSALAKLGVEIMDSEGNMRALHEITLDAQAAFGDVTDLEALTAMLEDMN
ncbi:phage tail tape measure protein, partial [Candidatus Pacearchaeota archaeon]|nr:phage tail tape measure protein [Candidatus Pacearchaeota archaeon]